jgi:hypothetical protein
MRFPLAILALVLCFGPVSWAGAQEAVPASRGQTLYVPVYSHILHGNTDRSGQAASLLLSSMLSIRNTDFTGAMKITSVRYYDTDGKFLREFILTAENVPAMASKEFFVENRDKSGGSGANFIVEWTSEAAISPPVVETVNAYFFGTQSIAFTSSGRVIRNQP